MLQMVGVLILTLGIPQVFSSIDEGGHVNNRALVAGYVVMRVAMVVQWLRAAGHDPDRRSACMAYASAITAAQVGWIAVAIADKSVGVTFLLFAVMIGIELSGLVLAEKKMGGTPWHAHHIVERNGLLTIIALGEGVVGTVASLSAGGGRPGLDDRRRLGGRGRNGLTFGMWWIYFVVPAAALLHAHRDRSFGFGYLHIVVFGCIVATGAGLHAAASYIEHRSRLGSVATASAVALPVGVYVGVVFGIYLLLARTWNAGYALLMSASWLMPAGAVWLATAGVSTAACLLVVTAAPAAIVVGFELSGHRHPASSLR